MTMPMVLMMISIVVAFNDRMSMMLVAMVW